MDQYQQLFSNSVNFFQQQHLQNTSLFNTTNLSNQCSDSCQEIQYHQHLNDDSSQTESNPLFIPDFKEDPDQQKPELINPVKKRRKCYKVSTSNWPATDATIIREQFTEESDLVREQVLIPETADLAKLCLQNLGPKCTNPLLCRKLQRKCSVFIKPLREHILKTFTIDLNDDERRMFILNNIESGPSKKANFLKVKYFLRDHRYNKRLQVCKAMFLNTLNLSQSDVKSVLKSSQCGMFPKVRYIPRKIEKQSNTNPYFFNENYGDQAISDYSDHDDANHFEDCKEESNIFSDPEDYDPLNRNAIRKDLPGASKTRNIEDIFKTKEVSSVIGPDQVGPRCASKRCKTCDNFNEERRSLLFSSFWNMMNWKERKDFILKTVICRKPNKTIYADGKSPRQFTYDYHLPLTYNLNDYMDPDVQLIPVCSIMYINTLGLKINVVKRFLRQGPDTFEEIQVEKIIQDPKYLLEVQMKTKHKRRVNWKAVQRALRAKGETYFTEVIENNESKYVQRNSKMMKPRCSGLGCKKTSNRHCWEITDAQREELFRYYWKELDKEQRKIFMCEHVFEDATAPMKDIVSVCKKKGHSIKPKTRKREATYRYHLPANGQKLQVCQTMFVGTLCVPNKSVRAVVKGSFGLLRNTTDNARFFVKEEPKKPVNKMKSLSDSESSSEDESIMHFDDKSSPESGEEEEEKEEVYHKKARKKGPTPISGWYKTSNRILKDRCKGGCKRQCNMITDSERESIFNHFWNLNTAEKDSFVRDLIIVDKTVRAKMLESAFEKNGNPLTKDDVPTRFRIHYFLPNGIGKEKIQVCMVMFEGTLSIGSTKIRRIAGLV